MIDTLSISIVKYVEHIVKVLKTGSKEDELKLQAKGWQVEWSYSKAEIAS
jgi:hypothetical protein